ncbi:MAG TPA: PIN domain-containing protein [Actinomycetota bacterium]
MLVSWTSEIECASAVARLERAAQITAAAARTSLGRLDAVAGSWHEIVPLASVRRSARRLLRVHPLRAGDALQLAAALIASEGDPSTLEFVCLDERLADAALREGFPVVAN